MRQVFFILLSIVNSIINYAQDLPGFKTLRFDEDYSFLKNDSSDSWYYKAKFNPITRDNSSYISLGGEIRYQYFYFRNENWGDAPKDSDGFVLSRFLFHADMHAGKSFRTFVQLQSSMANGKPSASPVDENQLDLHQAFIEWKTALSAHGKIAARIGRQEFSYGSQRLVGARDGPNNRQSFDAAKLIYTSKKIQIESFFSHYVRSRKKIFDDAFNKDTRFWGSYIVINNIPVLKNLDVYYLGLSKSIASFDEGSAKELRHSFGTRIWKRTGRLYYDFEGLYQSGHFGTKRISAWTVSSNTSYNFRLSELKIEAGLKAELISGDKKLEDGKLNSFNPLFPRGAYFGLASLIGPSNISDLHPSLSFELSRQAKWGIDYDIFWRYSKNDGIYAPNLALIYTGKNTGQRFIGQQYSTDLTYTPNQFLYFRAEFTWFRTGDYLKSVGTGKDILFTGVTAQLKF